VKKVNKNSPTLRWVFGGQTTPIPAHYERNAQIICIGRFMDLDFTFWGTGIWSATMSSRQGTIEKIPLVCNCWDVLFFEPSGKRGKYIEYLEGE
jgi:hypothetical protein